MATPAASASASDIPLRLESLPLEALLAQRGRIRTLPARADALARARSWHSRQMSMAAVAGRGFYDSRATACAFLAFGQSAERRADLRAKISSLTLCSRATDVGVRSLTALPHLAALGLTACAAVSDAARWGRCRLHCRMPPCSPRRCGWSERQGSRAC